MELINQLLKKKFIFFAILLISQAVFGMEKPSFDRISLDNCLQKHLDPFRALQEEGFRQKYSCTFNQSLDLYEVSPDGKYIAIYDDNAYKQKARLGVLPTPFDIEVPTFKVINIKTGEKIFEEKYTHKGTREINFKFFDKYLLLEYCEDRRDPRLHVTFDRDGIYIVNTFKIIDIEKSKRICRYRTNQFCTDRKCIFSTNGKYYALLQKYEYHQDRNSFYIHDLEHKKKHKYQSDNTSHFAFSPNNKYLAAIRNNNLFVFDLITHLPPNLIKRNIKKFSFSQNGKYLAAIDYDKKLSVFDTQQGYKITFRESNVDGFSLSPDNKYIVFQHYTYRTHRDKLMKVHLETNRKSSLANLRGGIIHKYRFSTDGNYLATCSKSFLRVFDIENRKKKLRVAGEKFFFNFSPDSTYFLVQLYPSSSSVNCAAISLYNLKTKKQHDMSPYKNISDLRLIGSARLSNISFDGRYFTLKKRKKMMPLCELYQQAMYKVDDLSMIYTKRIITPQQIDFKFTNKNQLAVVKVYEGQLALYDLPTREKDRFHKNLFAATKINPTEPEETLRHTQDEPDSAKASVHRSTDRQEEEEEGEVADKPKKKSPKANATDMTIETYW